jgi:hypothetical protein
MMPAGHEEDDHDEDHPVQDTGLRALEPAEDRPVDLERPIREPLAQHTTDEWTEDRRHTTDHEAGMNSIERCRPKVSGPIVDEASAKQPPPIDVTRALVANASTLYCAGYTPGHCRPRLVVAHRHQPTTNGTAHEVRGQHEHQ